jgi:hypothetical protein
LASPAFEVRYGKEKLAEVCRDTGEFPLKDALTINLNDANPGDSKILSDIENPVEAVALRADLLFAGCNVTVKRENNLLHICPID